MPPNSNAVASSSKAKSKDSKSKSVSGNPAVTAVADDIDSIFAKPKKGKSSAPSDTSSSAKVNGTKRSGLEIGDQIKTKTAKLVDDTSSKSKKKKKAKSETAGMEPGVARVVEVVDTSIPKVKEVAPPLIPAKTKSKTKKTKDAEEDEMFADSRGTGPRRKTEEGYSIYKEAELQIDPEAGGTPLCPFDCECCF